MKRSDYLEKIFKRCIFIILGLIKYLPFVFAIWIRGRCYKFLFKEMGSEVNIADAVTIINPSKISIGNRVSIHEYTYIAGEGEITIGDYVAIANNCTIISDSHIFDSKYMVIKRQGITPQPIKIGSDVWIGSKVTILGDVKIGNGAVIGAGAVVTKDIPEYAIAVGVPCKVIGYRGL